MFEVMTDIHFKISNGTYKTKIFQLLNALPKYCSSTFLLKLLGEKNLYAHALIVNTKQPMLVYVSDW